MQNLDEQTNCPVSDILRQVMDIWSVGVLLLLRQGKRRFSEILRQLPGNISKRMLSKTLRSLEEYGLIDRTVYPTKPPSVVYELSALGHSFLPLLAQLEQWAIDHQPQVASARQAFQLSTERDMWQAK